MNKNKTDDIQKLLRTGGARPAVPKERLQRAKDAARTVWQVQVEARRKHKRTWWVAGSLAAAALVTVVLLFLPREPVSSGATVTIGSLAAVEGVSVPVGVDIATQSTSGAAIRLSNGHSLRLDTSTVVRLESPSHISLRQGAVYVSSPDSSRSGASVLVTVDDFEIREIGTQFEVRVDDVAHPLLVRVREGSVRVWSDSIEQLVKAGTEFSLDGTGTTSTRDVLADDVSWDWTVGLSPMLDVEGRTAMTFLHWVAREHGWQLTFANPDVERHAGSAAVEGDLEGLTFEQALDIVMSSCELNYHIESGVLRVDSL